MIRILVLEVTANAAEFIDENSDFQFDMLLTDLYTGNNSVECDSNQEVTDWFINETKGFYEVEDTESIIDYLTDNNLVIEGRISLNRSSGINLCDVNGASEKWTSYHFVKVTVLGSDQYRVAVNKEVKYNVTNGVISKVYDQTVYLNTSLTQSTSNVRFSLANAGYTGCSGLNTTSVKLNFEYDIVTIVAPSVSGRPDWDNPDRYTVASVNSPTYLYAD